MTGKSDRPDGDATRSREIAAAMTTAAQNHAISITADDIGILARAVPTRDGAEGAGLLAILNCWIKSDHIQLHAGEMTAQELRSVKAVLTAVKAEIQTAGHLQPRGESPQTKATQPGGSPNTAPPKPAPDAMRLIAEWADRNPSAVDPSAVDELIRLARKACDQYRASVSSPDGAGEPFKTCPGCEMRRTCSDMKHCYGPSHAELKERFALLSPAAVACPGQTRATIRRTATASFRQEFRGKESSQSRSTPALPAILSLPVQPGAGEK